MVLETPQEAEHEPGVTAEALATEKLPIRLHSGAVRDMLPVGRDLKTEMFAQR
jgi:ribosomal protein L13